MKKSIVWVILILFFLIALGGNVWSSEDADLIDYPRYPIMRPDPASLVDLLDQYNFSEEAYIDEGIASSLKENAENNVSASKSLLSYLQYTPSERNQGSCGNCWVWGGTGVMEVNLNVNKGIKNRLSIQYLNSCRSGYACCGGSLSGFADWYNTQKKTIPWSNTKASFQDGSRNCDSGSSAVSCGSISTSTSYPISSISSVKISTQGVSQSTAIANIKNVLNQNKAVEFAFWLANSTDWNNFFNFWDHQSESAVWDPDTNLCGHTWNSSTGGGHSVVIVGYDDAATTPYWLVLNSWGTAGGGRPSGLFRMKMNMNYGCTMYESSSWWYSRQFSTLNMAWADPSIAITSPTPGSTFTSKSANFQWTFGAAEYWLYVGSGAGADNYYNSGSMTGATTSKTVSTLPSNGSTVYVRLWYRYTSTGGWGYKDYTYKACAPYITSPTPGSTLNATSVNFQWTSGAVEYWLYAGSSAGTANYYNSGSLGSATSKTASGLPNDGSTIYIRLWYRYSATGGWGTRDYTYKTVNPVVISPSPGSLLKSTSTVFTWSSGAVEYWLYAGSSAGSTSYFSSGNLGSATTTTVTGLPSNSSPVFITLRYKYTATAAWSSKSFLYSAMGSGFNSYFEGSATNWLQDSGTWSLSSGAYWYTAGRSGYYNTSTYNQTYYSFDYSARMWRAGDVRANYLIVRGSGSALSDGNLDSLYRFQYMSDGTFSVYKRISGGSYVAVKPWTASSAIVKGAAWNILRVRAVDSSLYFYINGTLVWSGTDTSLASGRVGVGMYRDTTSSGNGLWVDWATLSPIYVRAGEPTNEDVELMTEDTNNSDENSYLLNRDVNGITY